VHRKNCELKNGPDPKMIDPEEGAQDRKEEMGTQDADME